MKNKSFLFLIAALAIGLAFAGCSSDSDDGSSYPVPGPASGYAGPIADINAAFNAGASIVYLTKDTAFSSSDDKMLIIPSGKTLDLKGYALTDSSEGYLVVDGALKWDADNTSPVALAQSYIIAGKDYINTNVGTLSDTATKDRPIIVYGGSFLAGGSAVAAGGTIEAGATHFALRAELLESDDGNMGALNMPGFILGNLSVSNGFAYNGDGIGLVVTGNLTLSGNAGTIGGAGTVTVIGKLTDNVGSAAAGASPKVAGTLTAANIESVGGIFNIVHLTSTEKPSFFTTNAVEIGTFSAKGPVTFASDVAGTIIADNVTFNGKVNAYPDSTVNRLTFGNGAAIVTGGLEGTTAVLQGALNIGSAAEGGTLTVSKPLTLTGNASIVLGANGGFKLVSTGELITDKYELVNAGSLLNNATVAGTTVTLGASGITTDFTGQDNYTPTIVFGGEKLLLNFKDNATINGFNLDIKTSGSISIGTQEAPLADKTLTLTGGGSITTGATEDFVQGTLSTAKLYIVTNSAGSLAAGTNQTTGDKILAGSYGTFGADKNFIYVGLPIIKAGTKAAFGIAQSETGGVANSGASAGSLVVFNDAE
ncbi:MAG: hypothetical protein LBK66_13450 [Spirochaetaceae bacterium]|jgi:hypothetical protein|nr:hypothetical protein [Spirochaetaceae bacterium]